MVLLVVCARACMCVMRSHAVDALPQAVIPPTASADDCQAQGLLSGETSTRLGAGSHHAVRNHGCRHGASVRRAGRGGAPDPRDLDCVTALRQVLPSRRRPSLLPASLERSDRSGGVRSGFFRPSGPETRTFEAEPYAALRSFVLLSPAPFHGGKRPRLPRLQLVRPIPYAGQQILSGLRLPATARRHPRMPASGSPGSVPVLQPLFPRLFFRRGFRHGRVGEGRGLVLSPLCKVLVASRRQRTSASCLGACQCVLNHVLRDGSFWPVCCCSVVSTVRVVH